MKFVTATPAVLAGSIAVLMACTAVAQTPTPDASKQRELETARAELSRAARRVAELSGDSDHGQVMIQRRIERRPVLGVVLAPDPQAGARIAAVTPDSAAAKGGLRSGDRIVIVDGKPLRAGDGEQRLTQARDLLGQLDVKTPVAITVERDGQRKLVKVTPQIGERVFVFDNADGSRMAVHGDAMLRRGAQGAPRVEARAVTFSPPGVAPQVHREIIRLGDAGPCKGEACRFPLLAEAFRWNGLNLASVDPQLGRYFGTDRGVLVLSAGTDLDGLRPGDVIQSVGGKAVTTPREAMDALRAQPADSQVQVGYLRDRKSARVQVTVPKAMPLLPMLPPAPPLPPLPPAPPAAPPAPATIPAPPTVAVPPAPPLPPPPPAPPN